MMKIKKIAIFALSALAAVTLSVGAAACKTGGGNDDEQYVPPTFPTITTYSVTFNSNGGSAVPGATVNQNETVSNPVEPTRENYTFGGWFTNAECTGNPVVFPQRVTGDITYYAKWVPVLGPQTVINFTGAGVGMPQSITVDDGTVIDLGELGLENPTRAGYDFDGWLADGELVNEFTATGDAYYLTAKWTGVYDYVYVMEGLSDEDMITIDGGYIREDADNFEITIATMPEDAYDQDYYRFDGFFIGESRVDEGSTYTLTESVTIVARFTPSYNVVLDYNYEGAENPATQKVERGQAASITAPTRDNYRFMGWSLEENGEVTVLATATSYTPTAHTTLYAQWSELYTVSFAYADETSSEINLDPVVDIADGTFALGTPAFYDGISADTHYFAGWSTSNTAVDELIAAGTRYTITENITLYAHFSIIPEYTVRYAVDEVNGEWSYLQQTTSVRNGRSFTASQILGESSFTLSQLEGRRLIRWQIRVPATDGGTVLQDLDTQIVINEQNVVIGSDDTIVVYPVWLITAGRHAYRFEVETNAIFDGNATGQGGGTQGFFEYANRDTVSGLIVAGGIGASQGSGGANSVSFNVHSSADTTAMVALSLSPGNNQSELPIVDGTHYSVYLNPEVNESGAYIYDEANRVHFTTYRLPVLEGQNWNVNWGTAWFEMKLVEGDNTIVFHRPDSSEVFPNMDYMEIISDAVITQSTAPEGVTSITFDVGEDGMFIDRADIINDQGVAVKLPGTPDANNTVNAYVGTTIYMNRPTANPGNAISHILNLWRLQSPIRPGHVFASWEYSADGEAWAALTGNTVTVTENMVIRAVWNDALTVNYNLNTDDATATVDTPFESLTSGSAVNSDAVIPTRDDYAFTGWYTDEACESEFVSGTEITENITLYAGWTEAWTIRLATNGGTVPADTIYVPHGETVTLPTPVRAGYQFVGWFTDPTYTTEYNDSVAPTANMELYAAWQQTMTFTFSYNNAANAWSSPTTVTVEVVVPEDGITLGAILEAAGDRVNPVRNGYTFSGWALQTGGSSWNPQYGPVLENDYVFTAAVTIVAQWTS